MTSTDVSLVDPEVFEPNRLTEPGRPPGQLHDLPGESDARLTALGYDAEGCTEETFEELGRLEALQRDWRTVWLNVDGLGNADLLREIGEFFSLPPLILEDIQSVPQRPKAEIVDERLFFVTQMPRPGDDPISVEQVSLAFGEHHVVTFQQYIGGDVLDPVRDRIRRGTGHLRTRDADYLAYAILDTIVDSYLPILEEYDQQLTLLEAEILEAGSAQDVPTELYGFKRSIMDLERAARPQERMVQSLPRLGEEFFEETTRPYLQDCIDHAEEVVALGESARQTASSLLDLHLSMESQRMNEVMKLLTIIATIFIPLTFIAGVYGMNFDPEASPWNMPELSWYYGYPATLAVMFVLGVSMVAYFVRKGWIGGSLRGG